MKHSMFLFALVTAVLCLCSQLIAQDSTIKPGDRLSLTVVGEADLTKPVVVDQQGNITLPYVNQIHVAGLTPPQAADAVTKRLKTIMKSPEVTIELLEPARVQVTVSGQVRNPGIYQVNSNAKLMDAITMAGGYLESADMSKVTVSHAGTGQTDTIDLTRFLLSADSSVNVPVTGGDTIVVPSKLSGIGTVSVQGAVKSPGAYQITQGMTLSDAITMAGGPIDTADLNKITLRHQDSPNAVAIDYAAISSGDASANPILRQGDVIFVAARQQMGFYTISGAVNSPGRYELKGKTTLSQAIAIAGGTRGDAKTGGVRILRNTTGTPETMKANVGAIMAGEQTDVQVQDQDTIYVPQKSPSPDYLRMLTVGISLAWLVTRGL